MYRDVVDLREFYQTSLGQMALRQVKKRIREFWPNLTGQSVLGIGYATPYLRPFVGEAERVIAVMPATQGVIFWPPEGPGLTALSEEANLPFDDLSFDRVLVVHGLESTENSRQMLREIWRVLAGGGRMMIVAANRSGLWSMTERTPFGHGSPYSSIQLNHMLRDNLFVPERSAGALYIPPVRSRFWLSTAPAWERMGNRWFSTFAGVTMVEATKQLYAVSPPAVPVRRRLAFPRPVAEPKGVRLAPRSDDQA
ncbi:MAG TPA: methyltransferase domain-containing protein [Alphaproteobacteria bacterium]|jgi:SAM-dependent methyltransferase|nr:methyltransferase domain-containing protein [Alphaproteobacteria bacterium]